MNFTLKTLVATATLTVISASAWAQADGAVTAQERQRPHRMRNQASNDIRFQKHDRQRAPIAARG